jgi:hypothetical protein
MSIIHDEQCDTIISGKALQKQNAVESRFGDVSRFRTEPKFDEG